jgi:hypothetical protein
MTSWDFWEAYRISLPIFKKRTQYEGNNLNSVGTDAACRNDRKATSKDAIDHFDDRVGLNRAHCARRAQPLANVSAPTLCLAKLPVSLEYAALRYNTLQLSEVRAVHHRHNRPSVDVAQCCLQRMVRMQVRDLLSWQ